MYAASPISTAITSNHGGVSEENAAHIRHFGETVSKLPEAQRITLFYRPHIAPTMEPVPRAAFAPDTPLGFVRPSEAALAIARSGIGHIAQTTEVEFQVHIHHEYVTRNSLHCLRSKWGEEFFKSCTTPEQDSRRLDLLIRLSLEVLRQETGLAHDRWFFVHGNWGLNGGDPDVCQVADEL